MVFLSVIAGDIGKAAEEDFGGHWEPVADFTMRKVLLALHTALSICHEDPTATESLLGEIEQFLEKATGIPAGETRRVVHASYQAIFTDEEEPVH